MLGSKHLVRKRGVAIARKAASCAAVEGRKNLPLFFFFRDDQQLLSKVKVTFLVDAVLGIKRITVAQGVYLTTQHATEGQPQKFQGFFPI